MGTEAVFGERLKHARNLKGISQRQAAEEFGITKVGYQNYEYGRRAPSLEMLPRLARFFRVSADYLLGLNDEPRLPDKETLRIAREIQRIQSEQSATAQ